jgi:VIT1/CCC1 family predicted Fe2+/Mn2+ transporter
MTDKIDRLRSLDNEKLIDVVKNYRQYNYDTNVRNAAIGILEDRGIDKEQLKLTGNFENQTYSVAENIFISFKRNSIIALAFYILIIISAIFLPILLDSEHLEIITLTIILTAVILYFVFFIRSFINQIDFFKTIGQAPGSGITIIFFFIGTK